MSPMLDEEDLESMTTTDDLEQHEKDALLDADDTWGEYLAQKHAEPSDGEMFANQPEYDGEPEVFEDDINIDPPPATSREPSASGVPLFLPTDPTVEELHDEALAIKRDRIAYRADGLSRSALGVALVAVIECFNSATHPESLLFDALQEHGCTFGEAARIKDIYERLTTP